MADTTPKSNQLSVNMGILMNDALSGADNGVKAEANGLVVTAAKRNFYLNESYRWLIKELIARFGINNAVRYCSGLIKEQTVDISEDGVALKKDFLSPIIFLSSINFDEIELEFTCATGSSVVSTVLTITGADALSFSSVDDYYNGMIIYNENLGEWVDITDYDYSIADAGTAAMTTDTDIEAAGWLETHEYTIFSYSSVATRYSLIPKTDLQDDRWSYLNHCYAIEGGEIFVYKRISDALTLLNYGTGTFKYFKMDRVNDSTGAEYAANTAPDLSIDDVWLDACLNYAISRAYYDKGDEQSLIKAKLFSDKAQSLLPQTNAR